MNKRWRATMIVACLVLLGAVACADDEVVVRDELTTPGSANGAGVAWSIDWVRLEEDFTATSSVSVGADESLLIIDDGVLYRSAEISDEWQPVDIGDAQPRCFTGTRAGVVVAAEAPDGASSVFIERAGGDFVEVLFDVDGQVGCSFAWIDDRLWATVDDTSVVSVNVDGTDLHRASLAGPQTPIVGGLKVLSRVEPGVVFVEGIEPSAIDGANGVWAWRLEIGERPTMVDGLMRPSETGAVTVVDDGGILVLLGQPGVGFRTTTPLPSKAVLPLGDQAKWTNSIWQSPRHFVDAGDRIYGFGAFTSMGASEIDSALWMLPKEHPSIDGWSEHRGAGPRIDEAPLVAHRVAAAGNSIIMVACALNDADCDQSGTSTLWLGAVTPPQK